MVRYYNSGRGVLRMSGEEDDASTAIHEALLAAGWKQVGWLGYQIASFWLSLRGLKQVHHIWEVSEGGALVDAKGIAPKEEDSCPTKPTAGAGYQPPTP